MSIKITKSRRNIRCRKHEYLREPLLLEFGIRNSIVPSEKLPLKMYLSDIVDKTIELPISHVNTLSPIKTFWEKATLIHVECNRGRIIQTPEGCFMQKLRALQKSCRN